MYSRRTVFERRPRQRRTLLERRNDVALTSHDFRSTLTVPKWVRKLWYVESVMRMEVSRNSGSRSAAAFNHKADVSAKL